MISKASVVLVVLALVVAAAATSVVFVDEAEFVIITQFGRPVHTYQEAGPRLKLPWPVQSVMRIDKRIQIYDPMPSEFLASDKKTVNLDVFACWVVADPKKFRERVGDKPGAEARLHDMVWSELRAEVGRSQLEALVSTDKSKNRLDKLVGGIAERCAERAKSTYGIEIVDVRLKRITPPAQVRDSVFQRMRSERSRVARQLRAEGEEEALKIRADADKTRTTTLAAAYKDAETTRGKAEAEATRIYAAAHQKDPQFYELVRTLEAYRKILDEKTTILLSADSDLLKILTHGASLDDQKPKK